MKTTRMFLVPALVLCAAGYAENGGPDPGDGAVPWVNVANQVTTSQSQDVSASGGDSQSDSASMASVNINTTSISDYQTRTPPLTTFPPYLPYWTHGGWGTIKAYFPNGPTGNDQIYETTFDPNNPEDMREIRSVLRAVPHRGLLAALGGALNDVAVALFGKPDTYFRGRGLEIADSIVRDRRPEGKALLVFIDSNVDMNLLGEEGYAYVGKVSVEGDPDRNWDQAYKAAVAEALLWDVDILLISGGMKGVTTGTNVSFPSAAGGYSQVNYSLSLLGGRAKGTTEGQGKAVLSAEAYRYSPRMVERRRIPMALYDRIRARSWLVPTGETWPIPPGDTVPAPTEVSEPAGDLESPASSAPVAAAPAAPASATGSASGCTSATVPASAPAPTPVRAPASPRVRGAAPKYYPYNGPGITISRELFEMAGFGNDQQVGYVQIR